MLAMRLRLRFPSNNAEVSTVSLVPDTEHDGKPIAC